MKRAPRALHVALAVTVVTTAIFLPNAFFPDAALYSGPLAAPVRHTLAAVVKLGALLAGCLFAGRAASGLERDNPSRTGWLLFCVWLGASLAGQLVFSYYVVFLDSAPPMPSLGDALFFGGYAAMIAGAAVFVRAYRASGLPLGPLREQKRFGGAVALAAIVLGPWLLGPIALAEAPLGERVVNVLYPLLDLAALVPTLILLRMTRALRGGAVWTVWALVLGGIMLSCGGDVLYAYFAALGARQYIPLFDLLFMTGYTFIAAGVAAQVELQRVGA